MKSESIHHFNIEELEHQELISSKTGEIFSKSLVLTDLLQFQNIFVHHEILEPGRRASSPHSHTLREEMIYILAGFPTAHLGSKTLPLQPGDFVGFLPGEPHFIENTSDQEARFLVICSNPSDDQIRYS